MNDLRRLIITADDYGMCSEVDQAIDAGIENGFITTTNVMLNMSSLDAAATLRERYPELSIGIHWNVTTGRPVSNPKNIPTLVNPDGIFWNINQFKKRYSAGLIAKADLEQELEAQWEKFYRICGQADYWNTHENSSLHIKSFYVFAKVAQKHNIPATRTFQRVYFDKINLGLKRGSRELLVSIFFNIWFTSIRKTFKMPIARVVGFDKRSKTEGTILRDALLKDGRDLIEVVFHPAITADSPYFGNISTERVKEYEFVSSPQTVKDFHENGFKLVNFDF